MFERYTERARRVLFFARYEASQFGTATIKTEHLLLGLLRESKGLTTRLFQRGNVSVESLRDDLSSRMPLFREKIGTHVEIPFSEDARRALALAAEESDKLLHAYIGTEHLLLALLRDPKTGAGSVLAAAGLEYESVRRELIELLQQAAVPPSTRSAAGVGIDLSAFIAHVKQLVDRLAQAPTDSPEALALVDQIKQELDGLEPLLAALWLSRDR